MQQFADKKKGELAPILENKFPSSSSVFSPSALLREARRQKGLAAADVPPVCVFDPDGDILRRLKKSGEAKRFETWACYHTDLYTFSLAGKTVGIIGCVVGAPFAVLIAGNYLPADAAICLASLRRGRLLPQACHPILS